jgi:hypothetical protein
MTLRAIQLALLFVAWFVSLAPTSAALPDGRYLYVSSPGIRNYLNTEDTACWCSTSITVIAS